jgi:hypothetical protein
MTDLFNLIDLAQQLLARFFKDPATAVAVLIVGWRMGRKLDAAMHMQAVLTEALRVNQKVITDAAEKLVEQAAKIHHDAATVAGVHKITQNLLERLGRQLANDP